MEKMLVELVKDKVEYTNDKKEKKTFNVFYVRLPNGNLVRIMPHSYDDKEGKTHSNYQILDSIACPLLPFEK